MTTNALSGKTCQPFITMASPPGFLGGSFQTPLYHLRPCRRAFAGMTTRREKAGCYPDNPLPFPTKTPTPVLSGIPACLLQAGESPPAWMQAYLVVFSILAQSHTIIPAQAGIQWV